VNRRNVIVGLLTLCTTVCIAARRAVAWSLITEDELEHESTAQHPKSAPVPSQPGAPTIEVEQPNAAKPIRAPVTIRISLRPQAGATIDPASFRAKYGWLGLDITDRIIANAQVDASGLVAKNADIPAGQYRVTLQIADNFHRVGTRILEFRVL
jgi:hypothetical protein